MNGHPRAIQHTLGTNGDMVEFRILLAILGIVLGTSDAGVIGGSSFFFLFFFESHE